MPRPRVSSWRLPADTMSRKGGKQGSDGFDGPGRRKAAWLRHGRSYEMAPVKGKTEWTGYSYVWKYCADWRKKLTTLIA